MQRFSDTKTWLGFHGFKAHPFEHLAADTDPNLDNYFQYFPFFNEIEKPRCSFLFLERGTGKSANRIILTHQCDKSLKKSEQKLAVPYTDFSRLIKKDKVTLAEHVEEILKEAVPRLYDLCIQRGIEKLPEEFAKEFVWFVSRYSDKLSRRSLDVQLDKIEGMSDEQKKSILGKLTDIFRGQVQESLENIFPGASVLFDIASVFMNIKPSDKEKISQIEHSPLELMTRFAEIAQKFNINAIYILIDRVDEYDKVFQYEKAAAILKPLTETIPLLEMPHYAFKFFLPIQFRSELSAHLRSDRFDIYDYTWQPDELKKMFEVRLAAYCDEKKIGEEAFRSDFNRLFSEKKDIVSQMVQYANHSPRNLLQLGKIIFDEHTRSSQIDVLISKDTYERALSVFSKKQIEWRSQSEPFIKQLSQLDKIHTLENLLQRDYGDNSAHHKIEQWQKNDRFFATHFSLIDVIRSLNVPKSEAREKAREWEDAGLITAHYKITDESLAQFLFAKKGDK